MGSTTIIYSIDGSEGNINWIMNTNFSGADIRGGKVFNCYYRNANFTDAMLEEVDFGISIKTLK